MSTKHQNTTIRTFFVGEISSAMQEALKSGALLIKIKCQTGGRNQLTITCPSCNETFSADQALQKHLKVKEQKYQEEIKVKEK